jgi:hypothetical protein
MAARQDLDGRLSPKKMTCPLHIIKAVPGPETWALMLLVRRPRRRWFPPEPLARGFDLTRSLSRNHHEGARSLSDPPMSSLCPVRNDLHLHIAARRMAIGADLLVRLFRQRLQLRLR